MSGFSQLNPVPVANGGTASSTAATARTALSAAALGANTDITSLAGTATNDNAAAGKIGEIISSAVVVGSAVSLSTATGANITSISLTAGDWDVRACAGFHGSGTTVFFSTRAGINTTTATLPLASAGGLVVKGEAAGVVYSYDQVLGVPTVRVSVGSTTTVYLVAYSDFTTSTMVAYGFIEARRAR